MSVIEVTIIILLVFIGVNTFDQVRALRAIERAIKKRYI